MFKHPEIKRAVGEGRAAVGSADLDAFGEAFYGRQRAFLATSYEAGPQAL
jgi:hypothetical protein